MKKKVLMILVLAAVVAGSAFAQADTAAFNGGYSGAFVDSRNMLGSLLSETNGINYNGRAISGNSAGGNRVSITAAIQGSAAAVMSDGVTVGSWYYLGSGNTRVGIAFYIVTGECFIMLGRETVSAGLDGATFVGLSTSGMSTTYEGIVWK